MSQEQLWVIAYDSPREALANRPSYTQKRLNCSI